MKDRDLGKSNPAPGLTLHSAFWYDLLASLFTLGREKDFREAMLRPARLREGENVLDVGCGTGTLAILAKQKVGPTGRIHGVDASPEMIERARSKARNAKVDVGFEVAAAQNLPFEDASFDVVLSTLMLHHLPRPGRSQLAAEMRRVLRPGGRALAVDFSKGKKKKRLLGLFHASHGSTKLEDIIAPISASGLEIISTGPLGTKNLHFVLALSPGEGGPPKAPSLSQGELESGSGVRKRIGHPMLLGAALILLIILHFGAAASIFGTDFGRISRLLTVGIGTFAAALLVKLSILAAWQTMVRHRERQGPSSDRSFDSRDSADLKS